jgi:hypothetical protein
MQVHLEALLESSFCVKPLHFGVDAHLETTL